MGYRKLKQFTGRSDWKGFYRPKKENPDKDSNDKKEDKTSKKETSQEKFKRLMKQSGQALDGANKLLKALQLKKEREEAEQRIEELNNKIRKLNEESYEHPSY